MVGESKGKPIQLVLLERVTSRLSSLFGRSVLARMFHELLSRDRKDGRATGQPQGVGPEAFLNGTSQGELVLSLAEGTPEDVRKDGHIRGRSR